MLSVNGRNHVIRHVLTPRIFGTPKKLCFWQNHKEMFNQLNSTNWVELHKGHVQELRGEACTTVTGWGHMQEACKLSRMICIYKWAKFNGAHSLRIKCKCQLVVRLKANNYKGDISRYLSFYTNLLGRLQLVPTLWPLPPQTPNIGAPMPDLCVGVIGDVTSRPVWSHLYSEVFSTFGIVFHLSAPWSPSGPRRNSPTW